MKVKLNIFRNRGLLLLVVMCLFTAGCKKFVTVDPPVNALTGASIFIDDATATAAITGIYSRMMDNQASSIVSGNQSIGLMTGVSADELQVYTPQVTLVEFGQNNLQSRNSYTSKLWTDAYSNIYSANAVIEGIAKTSSVSEGVKKQLTGEARFIRALMHFYLLNLYGPMPYVTTTDYLVNQNLGRMPSADVYSRIIDDLVEAQNLLSSSYSFANNERSRPTKMAATALLARAYLYTGNWSKAESEASALISNSALFSLPALSQVFLKNSKEAIWQLQPVRPGTSSGEGLAYIFTTTPTRIALTNSLVNSFETGDSRKTSWVGSRVANNVTYYYPNKYKERTLTATAVPTEYLMVLRLAEQYLIRAEARANLNNITGAKSDLDAIRARAGLGGTTAADKAALLSAVERERRSELFTEWGHRWLDLKRTSRADAVMGALKGVNWQTTDQLYPLPQTELDRNPNLAPQNAGY